MKKLLIAIWISAAFVSACTKDIEPIVAKSDYLSLPSVSKTVERKSNPVLKTENRIPADEEVCELLSGCGIDETGKCIGCVVKKRDIATLDYDAGTLRAGEYRMTTFMEHTGKITRWSIPLKMSLRNVSEKTYLMTFSGIGKVGSHVIDCTKPYVAMFVLDENNIETSFRKLDGGSCPRIVSTNYKVKWESNGDGLKKMKSYSNGGCVVGPCDWISTMINVYFYERI